MTDRDYLQAIRDELREVEQEAKDLEERLAQRRREVMRLKKGLHALDPAWSAEQRRASKRTPGRTNRRADGSYPIAEVKVESVARYVKRHFADGAIFVAQDLPLDEIGMSTATRSAALNALQERGLIRLDSLGGPGTAKHFALVTSDA